MNNLKVGQWYRLKGSDAVYILSHICVPNLPEIAGTYVREYREIFALVNINGGYYNFGDGDTMLSAFGDDYDRFELVSPVIKGYVVPK